MIESVRKISSDLSDWGFQQSGKDEEESFIKNSSTPNNPNIIFKPLDTFMEKSKDKDKGVQMSEDSKLLLPFGNEEVKRMDTGNSSNDWLKSYQEGLIDNFSTSQKFQRHNTPGISDSIRLFPNNSRRKKLSPRLHYAHIEEQPDSFPRTKRNLNKHNFMRQATIALKRKASESISKQN